MKSALAIALIYASSMSPGGHCEVIEPRRGTAAELRGPMLNKPKRKRSKLARRSHRAAKLGRIESKIYRSSTTRVG